MSLAFKTVKLSSGESGSVTFEGIVKSAGVAVQDFSGEFPNSKKGRPKDHHIADLDVWVRIQRITGGTVTVHGVSGFADARGGKSTGDFTALVMADLA